MQWRCLWVGLFKSKLTGGTYCSIKGEHSSARIENRAFAIQTLSATGAIRIGAEFLAESLGFKTVYCSQQAEKNIKEVFLSAGEHYDTKKPPKVTWVVLKVFKSTKKFVTSINTL